MEDLRLTAKLAAIGLVSWLVPFDKFAPTARKIRHWRGEVREYGIEPIVADILGDRVSSQRAHQIDAEWRAKILEARMQILALHRPRRSWEAKIQMQGLEHLDAALAKKSGAILWVSDFVYSSLITKIAFWQAGYPVSHLSRRGHGFSPSPYGVRVLNKLWTSIEDRFVNERITIDSACTSAALRVVRNRLAANSIVSITVGSQARNTVQLPFFKGEICLATGPVHLSQTSQAPLLPVFTFRNESEEYTVCIGPAISEQVITQQIYAKMIGAYVAVLERFVLRYPDQWSGWRRVVKRSGSNA
jgi:lauroyl/myristoyl acyltransferase